MLAGSSLPTPAETYLDESQALAAVFGPNAKLHREQKLLDENARAGLEKSSNLEFPESSYTFFVADQNGKTGNYAMVMNEIGKSEPITFMVGMTPEGKVADVAVMVFRENRGWEVKEKRFLNQFRGKSAKNSIRVNEDILNYTGATLSSKAIARGVKKALLLFDFFYPPTKRSGLQPAGPLVLPYTALPLTTAFDAAGPIGLYRQRRIRMGTVCEIRAWCRSSSEADRAFSAGFSEIERVEQIFSAYRPDSELSLVNRESSDRAVPVSTEFLALTKYAIHSTRYSLGNFDISIGPLMSVWGLRDGRPRIPGPFELRDALALVGCDYLRLEQKHRTIRFLRPGMSLDFGGLAKGYAAQRATQIVRRHGAVGALVNLGNSSLSASRVTSATSAGGNDPGFEIVWPIGIRDLSGKEECALYFMLRPGWSVSTSGTYEQMFRVRKKQWSHIIHPRTGYPLQDICSLTALCRSGPQCEVLSKSMLTLPHADCRQLGFVATSGSRSVNYIRFTHKQNGITAHLLKG